MNMLVSSCLSIENSFYAGLQGRITYNIKLSTKIDILPQYLYSL